MLIKETDFKFDWYRSGVDTSHDALLHALSHGLADFRLSIEPSSSFFNYDQAALLTNGSVRYANVMWGGNTGTSIYCESTGAFASNLADFLRKSFRDSHFVMRCDAALDISGGDSFLDLAGALSKYAESQNMVTTNSGDWSTGRAGRTLYVGSRSSDAFLRFYEKGKQLGADPDWLRFEVQAQPSKMNKKMALAFMSPFQVFSSCKAGLAVLGMLGICPDIVAIDKEERPRTDKQRALEHMLAQYSNTLSYFADRDSDFYVWLAEEVQRRKSS